MGETLRSGLASFVSWKTCSAVWKILTVRDMSGQEQIRSPRCGCAHSFAAQPDGSDVGRSCQGERACQGVAGVGGVFEIDRVGAPRLRLDPDRVEFLAGSEI